MAAPTRLCAPPQSLSEPSPRGLQLVQLPGPALGKRTPTNTPESQFMDVHTIWTCNPGAPPTPAAVWVKEVGVHLAHAHQRRRPCPLSLPTRRQWLGDSTPFSFQDRVPPPPRDSASFVARAPPSRASPERRLPWSSSRDQDPTPLSSSWSARPGNKDAVPVPSRRYPNPVSLLRVGASHRIYGQKGIEGGADPVNPAAACAPRGGAEPSRAERSRAERGRAGKIRAQRGGGERSRAERSPVEPCQGEPSSAGRCRAPGELSGQRANKRGRRSGGRRKAGPGAPGKTEGVGAVPAAVVSRFSGNSDAQKLGSGRAE